MKILYSMMSGNLAKVGFCTYAGIMFAVPGLAAGIEPARRDREIAIHKTLWKIYAQQQNLEAALKEVVILESLTKDPPLSVEI